MAIVSNLSLYAVEVPCALMYATSLGGTSASARAFARHVASPRPSGCGVVMWCASHVAAYPASSQ